MRYFVLYDNLAPEGDLYEVDENTQEAWCVDPQGQGRIPAFIASSHYKGTTPYEELLDYAGKYGSIKEVECPES